MHDETSKAKAEATGRALAHTGIGLIVTLAFIALFAWLAGVALNVGFGVHAPFVATTLLLAVGVSVVKLTATEVASTWHRARVEADVRLLAASMAVQREESLGGLAGFLSKLDKDSENTDNGAYL